MRRLSPVMTLVLACLATNTAASQTPAARLMQQAYARYTQNDLDSAAILLRAALVSATETADSVAALSLSAIVAFQRGDEPTTHAAFREVFSLGGSVHSEVLQRVSPRLADLYEAEQRGFYVHVSADVDEKPRRLTGPHVRYPPDLVRRQVRGRALVALIVDTLGQVEPNSIDILEVPDSGLMVPVSHMVLGSTFAPGRVRGHPVRTLTQLAIDLVPGTPPNATALVNAARARLTAHQPDSALALVREALDPSTQPTEGERVYALLVQGIAWKSQGRDTLAQMAFDTALANYRSLTNRGVELAPFLKRLADSVRLGRTGRTPNALGQPTVIGTPVDVAPTLRTQPALRYPPEMQALHVGGTVTIEATVDTTGRVLAGSIRVVRSSNPGFDAEARRIVAAAVYRPGQRSGRAVSTSIRQTITFAPY